MITQAHLDHWLDEIQYQLTGILNEVSETKLQGVKGVEVPEKGFVSFEYINEKAITIKRTIKCIEDDIKND